MLRCLKHESHSSERCLFSKINRDFSCSYIPFKICFKIIPKTILKTDTADSWAVTNCREALSTFIADMTKTESLTTLL